MIPFSYLEQVVLGSLDPSVTTTVKQTLKDTHEWKIMYKKLNNGVKSAQIRSVFFFVFFHHMRQTILLTMSSRSLGRRAGEKQRRRKWKIEASGPWRAPILMIPQPCSSRWPSSFSSLFCSSAALTQASDVGPAARGCHDALGGPARNVVVNLSSCEMKYKVSYLRLCYKILRVQFCQFPRVRNGLIKMYRIVLLQLKAVLVESH